METNDTKTKADKSALKSRKALKKLIEHARKNKGTMTQVAELMTKKAGQPVLRQQVEVWLNPDESKRREPRLGTGLFLIECQDEIVYGGIKD